MHLLQSKLSSPAFSGTQPSSSVHSPFFFFFGPTDRTTIARDEAMGNETFYHWDGLTGLKPRRKMTKLRNSYQEDIAFMLCF